MSRSEMAILEGPTAPLQTVSKGVTYIYLKYMRSSYRKIKVRMYLIVLLEKFLNFLKVQSEARGRPIILLESYPE